MRSVADTFGRSCLETAWRHVAASNRVDHGPGILTMQAGSFDNLRSLFFHLNHRRSLLEREHLDSRSLRLY